MENLLSSEIRPALEVLLWVLSWSHLSALALLTGGVTAVLAFTGSVEGREGLGEKFQAWCDPLRIGIPLVLLVLLHLYGIHLLHRPDPEILRVLSLSPLLLAAGLVFLMAYRRLPAGSGMALPAGASGLLFLLAAAFSWLCAENLLLRPDVWPAVGAVPVLALSWNAAADFLQFLALTLALTGIAGSLAAGSWEGRRVWALAALCLWAPVLLFDLFNLPQPVLSPSIFLFGAAGVVAAAVAAWFLLDSRIRKGRSALVMVLLLFFFWTGMDLAAQGNALDPQIQFRIAAQPPSPPEEPKPPAEEAKGEEALAARGEEIFQRVCSACHRFDRRVVGPPLEAVLPKYEGNRKALEDFIRNPVKIDPDYPAMPKLGLSEEEIAAVAAYLLEEMGE